MIRIGRANSDVTERKTLLHLLSLLLLVVIAGCAHEQAYKKGMDWSRQGQYERAVGELETAIRLAEDNHDRAAAGRYHESLEEVKRAAGQFYCRQAETQFEQADLSAAQTSIDRCIGYCPQEPSYPALRQRIASAIASAQTLRTEALSLAEQRQWQPAVERMSEALRIYRTLPGGSAELKSIQERAYQYYLARAQEQLRNNDLQGAEVEAGAALSYLSGGREARELLRGVANRREAATLTASGRSLLEQGEPEEALRALEQANSLYPSQSELPALLARARQAVCDRWIAQGRQATDAGQYAAALRLFQKSRDLLSGYGNVDPLIADAKSRLATSHLDASRQYLQSNANGCAVFHAAVALGYRPGYAEAQRQLDQCIAQVRQDVRYTIEFIGVEAPPEHRAIANMLGSVALEHLSRLQSANVRIVDRIDRQANRDGPAPAGVLNAARASLVGQMLDCRVTTDTRRTGEGESIYQDGFRPERNPDHAKVSAELDAALKELERAKDRLADAETQLARYEHADREDREAMARKRKAEALVAEAKQRLVTVATRVGIAQGRLAATPREVLVPNMVRYQYPIQTATWTAKITILVKMVDADTGELILADRLEGEHTLSDRFVPADPARNVPEDPLVLPETERLLEAAANSMIGKLRQSLNTACDRHGQRFAVQMQRAQAAGDRILAADTSMKYLFAYPTGNADTSRMVGFLHTYLGEEDGLVDLQRLLQTHCRIMK